MAQKFKVGDVVMLKSGGPQMTVDDLGEGYDGDPFIKCVWFAGAKHQSDHFSPETLIHVEVPG